MELSGAEALIAQLEREGVRHVFGVPGVQLDHVLDALARSRAAGGPIEYIAARHEQGAAHMAEAYARTAERPGVRLVVPGPGVLNALSAGYACSSPMLCVAADIPSAQAGRGWACCTNCPTRTACWPRSPSGPGGPGHRTRSQVSCVKRCGSHGPAVRGRWP